MLLTHTGARFELSCIPSENFRAQHAGFHWDHRAKLWWTARTDLARIFNAYADYRALHVLGREQNQIDLSWAMDAKINIPVPEGLEYLPFQKGGIAYALPRRHTLFGDEPGLGKTVEAIGIINALPKLRKILIIPPAFLKINWSKELVKWLVLQYSGGIASSNYFPDTDIVIANYEQIWKFRQKIDSVRWDLVIGDEVHYLKNPATKRTRAVLGSEAEGKTSTKPIDCGMDIWLTGTPILNRPAELWPLVRHCDPIGLGSSAWSFYERYCNAHEAFGEMDISGASNLEELQTRLRSSFMVRRKKADVLKELPPKRRQIIAIPADTAKQVINHELNFYEKHQQDIESALQDAETAQAIGSYEQYVSAGMALKSAKRILFEQMAALRHATALAKVPFAISYIESMLLEHQKMVVYCYHKDVLHQLYDRVKNISVYMEGDVPIELRQTAVDRFQKDEKVRIIFGTHQTIGVGWTLTASSYGLFVEEDWVAAIITQDEDRMHRIGQREAILLHHLVFDGSIDATQVQKTIYKQEISDRALG